MAAEFVDCVFSGRLHGAVFNGTVSEYMAADLGREKNQFEGNDFSKARLDNVAFRTGIDLRKQKLPEGANYRRIDDAPRFIDRARVGILTWPASEKRRLALVAVDSLKFEATNGQNDIFISFDTYSPTVRAAMEEVLSQFS